jgi:hypothetical protein
MNEGKHNKPVEWKLVYQHRSSLTDSENRTRMEAESDRVSDRIVKAIGALRQNRPNTWLDELDTRAFFILKDALDPIGYEVLHQDEGGAWIVRERWNASVNWNAQLTIV